MTTKKTTKKGKGLTIVPTPAEVASEPVQLEKPMNTYERICHDLALTPDMTRKQQKVSHWFEFIEGGTENGGEIIYEYLRGSDDVDVQKLLEVYDKVDVREKDFLSFEEYCAAAGVSTVKVWGKLAEVTVTQSDVTSGIMAAMAHPKVLKTTIDMAQTPGGHRERKLLHTASGFLPRPKGSQTNVTFNNANVTAQTGSAGTSLPPFDQDIRDLGERFQVVAENKSKLLEGK
jgi:hypothetical protein